jgi:hypothetical protein
MLAVAGDLDMIAGQTRLDELLDLLWCHFNYLSGSWFVVRGS